MKRHRLMGLMVCLIFYSCNVSRLCPFDIAAVTYPQVSVPLLNAHSHNDYKNDNPLFDALAHGFNSVEVDIHYINGQLYVGHFMWELKTHRTLESLYLNPLAEIISRNGGYVFPNCPPFQLLIDIKTHSARTYLALREVLADYDHILTAFTPDSTKAGPIVAIISGNRPRELMEQENILYACFDGRLKDLSGNDPCQFTPLISDRWTDHFSWEGDAPISLQEYQKLVNMVDTAHQQGRKIRFWALPEGSPERRQRVWSTLLQVHVDYINTDKVADLAAYLRSNKSLLVQSEDLTIQPRAPFEIK